jgi:hypothetical protein
MEEFVLEESPQESNREGSQRLKKEAKFSKLDFFASLLAGPI